MKRQHIIAASATAVTIIAVAAYLFTLQQQQKHPITISPEYGVVPSPPDYSDSLMWYVSRQDPKHLGADIFYIVSTWEFDWTTESGDTCHYADVWNERHRAHMAKEQAKIAACLAQGNDLYAPYYRHITLNTWATQNPDTIRHRAQLAMSDVMEAFNHFIYTRPDHTRPIILAGFSQGAMAVVELLKHMDDHCYSEIAAAYVMGYKVTAADTMATTHIKAARDSIDTGVTICYNSVKDVKYTPTIIADSCIMCINPVNWRTDATPATLHDTITVTIDPEYHVLVVNNYSADEYKPILGFVNVGDIHGCEPWLYSESLAHNIKVRSLSWRQKNYDPHKVPK